MSSTLYQLTQGLLNKKEEDKTPEEVLFERTQRLLRGETPQATETSSIPSISASDVAPTDAVIAQDSVKPKQVSTNKQGEKESEFILWRDDPFFQELRRYPKFRELLRVQALAAEVIKDPSKGDITTYFNQIEDLTEEIIKETGLGEHSSGEQLFKEFINYELTGQVGPSAFARNAMNVLGAAVGVLEFLAFPGDFVRTLMASLSEQQAKRQEGEDYEMDIKGGKAAGSPATNPIQAANDLAHAYIKTLQQMGVTEFPWTRDEEGDIIVNQDSAWIMYLPSIILNGNRLWGSSPYEADRAVRGAELNERFGWFQNCDDSDNPEMCKELFGIATEVATDPLLWADALFLAAKTLGASAKVLPSSTALAARGVDDLGETLATQLNLLEPTVSSEATKAIVTLAENAARSVYQNTTLYGATAQIGKLLTLSSFSGLRSTLNVMNRVINRVLDMDAPAFFLPRGTQEAAGAFGWTAPGPTTRPTTAVPTEGFQDAPFRPKWRDVLFQQGQLSWLKNSTPNHLLGSPERGLSAAETALGKDATLRAIAARGASEMQAALTKGLTVERLFRMPWVRAAFPNASVIKPEFIPYINAMGAVVSDVLENVGVTASWRSNEKIVERVNRLSTLYDIPFDDTARRIDQAVMAGNKVILQTGYHVSGYQDFVLALNRSLQQNIDNGLLPQGVSAGDVRRALELRAGNIDLQELELGRQITMGRPDVTGATFAAEGTEEAVSRILNFWDANPKKYEAWRVSLADQLNAAGRADLAGFTPEQYLAGLASGYMRREFEMVNNLEAVRHGLSSRQLIVMRNLRVDSARNPIGTAFGADAGKAFANFVEIVTPPSPRNVIEQKRATEAASHQTLAASPEDAAFVREWFEETGTMKSVPYRRATHFTAADAADAINRQTGLNLTPENVADAIWENSTSRKYLQQTLDLITQRAGRVSGASQLTVPWSQTPAAFAERELFDLPALAQLVMVRDPVNLTASVGMRAGRQIRAKSFLDDAFDFLQSENLLRDPSDIGLNAGQALPTDTIFPFQTGDGAKYVVLPDKPELWGPLAGRAIPESIAQTFVYAQRYGMAQNGVGQRVFNMWRQMLLSPLQTSLRNVVSNYVLIWQAGGDMPSLLANTPKAHVLNRDFGVNGNLPEEFKGYEHLFSWISASTLSGTVEQPMEKFLQRVVSNQENLVGALEGAEEFVNWLTTTPPLGFLNFFKWGEEVSRTAAFLSTYDTLIENGLSKSEAINRAAHFAVNSAHNYAMAPLLPNFMKQNYLSAFPQFNYFMISRNVRTVLENPGTLQKPEYARQAINTWATGGDLEEQERVTALMADWERYSYPLLIPIPGKNGEYYNVNMGFFFPTQSGVGPQVFLDPFTGVSFAPIIDAGLAWINNNNSNAGKGYFGVRFGQEVYDPSAPLPEQILQTGAFLGGSYFMPRLLGPNGSIQELMEASAYNENKELFDLIGLSQAKHYNLDWAQVFARNIGLNARKVSVLADGVNIQQREEEIKRYYNLRIARLNKQIEELNVLAMQAQGPKLGELIEEIDELQARSIRFEMDKYRDINQLYKMVR